MSEKFGEKIRRIRIKSNQTLEVLAAAVGSSKAYIWQLENKTNAKPSAELLLKIANHFGQSPDFFLDDTRDEPTESQLEDAFFRKFRTISKRDKREVSNIVSRYDQKSRK